MSKRNIQWAAPEEPSFLKKMKAKMGYKNTVDSIDTKTEKLKKEDTLYDKEEEEPVYVFEETSYISEKEVETYKTKIKNEREAEEQDNQDAKEAAGQKKIIFQKPTKKKEDIEGQSSSKHSNKHSKKPDTKDQYRKYVKPVKNSNLLSFGDDDEDEEGDED